MTAGFSVTISAVDNVTAGIDKINKKFASMTAPVTRLNASMKKFSDVSGINKLTAGVNKLGSGIVNLGRSAVGAIAPLGAISSAASVAGIIALTEHFADFGSQLKFTAANIGIQVDSLHALRGAATLAGASGESLSAGMLNLSQAITDASGGRNMEALGYFRQLGINIRGANGALRTADEVLPDVADGIAKISNPQLQRRVAQAFGLSDDLLPFLRRGAQGLREYEAEARKYGVINAAGAQASDDLRMAQAKLTLSVEGLGYSVAEKLAPVLTPMLADLSNWTAAHRTDVAETFGNIAKQFSDWAKSGSIPEIRDELRGWADDTKLVVSYVDPVIQATIGWRRALEGLGVVIALRIAGLGRLVTLMARLALANPAVSLPLLLSGDTDPNATPDGFRKGWKPNNTGFLSPDRTHYGPSPDDQAPGQYEAPKTVTQAFREWITGKTVPGNIGGGADALGVDALRYNNFREAIGSKESNRWDVMGGAGNRFAGRYQMGPDEIDETAKRLGELTPSAATFLGDPGMQNRYFDAYTKSHDDRLMQISPEYQKLSPAQRLQALAYAHNQGADGAAKWLQSGVSARDGFGTDAGTYADLVARRTGIPRIGTGGAAVPMINGQQVGSFGGQAAAAPAAVGGTVKVEIVNRNAPPGTSMTATSTGNVSTTARVETSNLTRPN